jgi:hypothetical protein
MATSAARVDRERVTRSGLGQGIRGSIKNVGGIETVRHGAKKYVIEVISVERTVSIASVSEHDPVIALRASMADVVVHIAKSGRRSKSGYAKLQPFVN